MIVNVAKSMLLSVAGLLICLTLGCSGTGKSSTGTLVASAEISADNSRIAAPMQLPVPDGVEPHVWKLLTAELARQLDEIGRTASTPPTADTSQAVLGIAGSTIGWGYYSQGDYDQNGEVNASDLTPLAIHFLESALPSTFLPDTVQAVVDGDGNGEINVADVTPIAINFHNTVSKYNVYRSRETADYPADADSDNGSAELLGSIELTDGTGQPSEVRLQFVSNMPEFLDRDYFWSRPADNEGAEGIASNLAGPVSNIYTLDGYVFMAGGGSDPLPGVPVELTGDATDLTTTDANGHYVFEGLLNGDYIVTPSGDPYGYAPENINTSINNADRFLSPIYPAPVDITHRWTLDYNANMLAQGIAIDDEQNIYLSGQVWQSDVFRSYVLKFDLFGNLLWSRVLQIDYDVVGSRIYTAPGGGIYLYGVHKTDDVSGPDNHDLMLIKMDSSGNIEWDLGFNYPTSDFEDHQDMHAVGYADPEGKFYAFAGSRGGPDNKAFLLEISPSGEIVSQRNFEADFVGHDIASVSDVELDSMGYWLIGGAITGTPAGSALIMRINPAGALVWSNNWGSNNRFDVGSVELGLTGDFYTKTSAYLPGDPDTGAIQLTRFSYAGAPAWDVLCTSEYSGSWATAAKMQIGPRGMLWVAGEETVDPDDFNRITSPFVWSLRTDGSKRFAKLWACEGNERPFNTTSFINFDVNVHGVVAMAATAPSHIGEWQDYDMTVEEYLWSYEHPAISTHSETIAPKRDLAVTEISEEGIIDPAPMNDSKHLIMLYRP